MTQYNSLNVKLSSSQLNKLMSAIKNGTDVILELVSAIFYEIFIFSPNDSPSNIMKNVFYFIQKALFVLEIFKFL